MSIFAALSTKKKFTLVVAIPLVLLLFGLAAIQLYHHLETPFIPILCYHNVSDIDSRNDNLQVGPAQFEAQLKFLRDHQYHPVTLDQIFRHLTRGDELPARTVALTFDDGYLNNWTYAFPLLKKYRVPATIFLVTSKVRDSSPVYRPNLDDVWEGTITRHKLENSYRRQSSANKYLTWEELARMTSSGLITVASHGHAHEDLACAPRQEVRKELLESKRVIEEKLETECIFIAWPFGHHSRLCEKEARDAGYLAAFRVSTQLFGGSGNGKNARLMALKRIAATDELSLSETLAYFHNPSASHRLRAIFNYVRYHCNRITAGG